MWPRLKRAFTCLIFTQSGFRYFLLKTLDASLRRGNGFPHARASPHCSCTQGIPVSSGKERKRKREDRPPRHVNEFFEGRAGRRDDRQEAGIRGARKPRGGVGLATKVEASESYGIRERWRRNRGKAGFGCKIDSPVLNLNKRQLA